MEHKQRGVAIVEFALILPFLLILTFITVEFGRALYEYNIIAKSVRDAARYLSMQDPTIVITDPGKVATAKNLVVYGIPKPTTEPPLTSRLALSQVPNPTWAVVGSNPSVNLVTIRVTGYKFKLMIPTAFGRRFGDANGEIGFGDISATMRAQS